MISFLQNKKKTAKSFFIKRLYYKYLLNFHFEFLLVCAYKNTPFCFLA